MNDNPASVLFVTGCNSGVGAEKDNTKLSEQRAQAISDYLQDVWKVQGKRIVVQKQNLPDKPSAAAGDVAATENRRVELSSNVPEIFEPIKGDNISKLANPPVLRFGIDINAGAGLKQWELEASQFVDNEAVTLKNFNGTKEYPASVDWKLNEEPNTVPQSGQDLSAQLTMTDINNKTGDAPITSIAVEQITVERKELDGKPDKRIDVYDVIGFDAGVNVDEAGQKLIETIKKSLKPNARVTLTAYTDNTVDVAQSKDLAKRRADAVGKAIGASNPTVRAVGVTQMNDNSLPEGRAYNRVVRVEVQTPVR
jgi:outer membrane protein OmpA-like peptidoglycan-associated protein